MNSLRSWPVLVAFTFLFVVEAFAADNPNSVIALKAARLFDGKSKTLVSNGVVIVETGKIREVGSNIQIPAEAQVIDLGDATLSPGFMDAHTHLTLDYSGNYNERRLKELDKNISEMAFDCVPRARATLEAGSRRCAMSAVERRTTMTLSMWRCVMRSTTERLWDRVCLSRHMGSVQRAGTSIR